MMPFGYPFYAWLKSNPAAQWALAIGAAYIAFRVWIAAKVRRAFADGQRAGEEQIIEQIEEQTNERIEDAREASRSTDDLNAEQLRRLRAADPNNRSRVP